MDHKAVLSWHRPESRDRFLVLRRQLTTWGYLPAAETIELVDLLNASSAEGMSDGQPG